MVNKRIQYPQVQIYYVIEKRQGYGKTTGYIQRQQLWAGLLVLVTEWESLHGKGNTWPAS